MSRQHASLEPWPYWLGYVSHELRSPISVCAGYARLIERELRSLPGGTERAGKMIAQVQRAAHRLGAVEGVLDAGRRHEVTVGGALTLAAACLGQPLDHDRDSQLELAGPRCLTFAFLLLLRDQQNRLLARMDTDAARPPAGADPAATTLLARVRGTADGYRLLVTPVVTGPLPQWEDDTAAALTAEPWLVRLSVWLSESGCSLSIARWGQWRAFAIAYGTEVGEPAAGHAAPLDPVPFPRPAPSPRMGPPRSGTRRHFSRWAAPRRRSRS